MAYEGEGMPAWFWKKRTGAENQLSFGLENELVDAISGGHFSKKSPLGLAFILKKSLVGQRFGAGVRERMVLVIGGRQAAENRE